VGVQREAGASLLLGAVATATIQKFTYIIKHKNLFNLMKNKTTTYIIGAGASFELGLPTGEQLKDQISKLLNINFNFDKLSSGDQQIVDALNAYIRENKTSLKLNEYRSECIHISENLPLAISIDNLIDNNRGNATIELCGKLGIVKSIILAEKKSLLFEKNNEKLNFSNLINSWYLPFFKTLTENCTLKELTNRLKSITLIIFNYDRCIEHFIINALISYYRLNDTDAYNLFENLTIIHPYGTIGSLQWQKSNDDINVPFGGNIPTNKLIQHAQNIKTFTEGTESSNTKEIHNAIEKADRTIFLGFAYHKINMKLLGKGGFFHAYNSENKECFGTSYAMSENDKELVINSIKSLYEGNFKINIVNLTCSDLFNEYSRSLSYT